MNLGSIILSQTGEDKYMMSHTQNLKILTHEFLYKTETDSENELMVIRGRLGEGLD